jgi:hypothetical protein
LYIHAHSTEQPRRAVPNACFAALIYSRRLNANNLDVLWHYHSDAFFDNKQHHSPHIHARYGEHKASFDIGTAELFAGSMPSKQIRLIQAWLEIHKEELLADWQIAVEGGEIFKIEPLK